MLLGGLAGYLASHVGIAVAVGTHPRPETDKRLEGGSFFIIFFKFAPDPLMHFRHQVENGSLKIKKGLINLIRHVAFTAPDFGGLPEDFDGLPDPVNGGSALLGSQVFAVKQGQCLGYAEKVVKNRPPFGLRGVGGEDQLHFHFGKKIQNGLVAYFARLEVAEKFPNGHFLLPGVIHFIKADPSHPLQLFGDIDQLEINREGPGNGMGLFKAEGAHGLHQFFDEMFGRIRILADFLGQDADFFNPRKNLFAFLFADHIAQQRGQKTHVSSQRRGRKLIVFD